MKLRWFFILGLIFLPVFAFASVIINEVAWMGTGVSSADEWIELYNNGSENVDLVGWILKAQDDAPTINLSGSILANSFFLLERTDDTTVPSITADLIYTGALSNDGEVLILKNASGNEVDRIDASGGWPAGDNATKQTMQKVGSNWVTAIATPRAVNFVPLEPLPAQQPESQPSGGGLSQYIPPENLPKIKAYAGEDKTAVVGAAVEFRGQAFGLNDEPLDNARYLWTFGDGASKEGQNITHVYQYPGEYIVILNVSSGQYSASDTLLIKAMPNQLSVSEAKPGFGGWIELYNGSKEQIDISGCQLKSGNQIFIFPKSTFIRPSAYLVIPVSVSGAVLAENKGVIELLYPGGFKAGEFYYEGLPKDGESFSFTRDSKVGAITKETPGAANLIPQVKTNVLPQDPVKHSVLDNDDKSVSKEAAFQENNQDIEKETGNVAASAVGASASNNKIYYFAVLGLIIFAIAAVLLVRRRSGA